MLCAQLLNILGSPALACVACVEHAVSADPQWLISLIHCRSGITYYIHTHAICPALCFASPSCCISTVAASAVSDCPDACLLSLLVQQLGMSTAGSARQARILQACTGCAGYKTMRESSICRVLLVLLLAMACQADDQTHINNKSSRPIICNTTYDGGHSEFVNRLIPPGGSGTTHLQHMHQKIAWTRKCSAFCSASYALNLCFGGYLSQILCIQCIIPVSHSLCCRDLS